MQPAMLKAQRHATWPPRTTWLSYPGFQAAQGLLAVSMRLSTRGRDEQPHMASWPLSRLRGMLLGLPEHAGADIPASRLRRVYWR